MRLPRFDVLLPRTVEEACAMLEAHSEDGVRLLGDPGLVDRPTDPLLESVRRRRSLPPDLAIPWARLQHRAGQPQDAVTMLEAMLPGLADAQARSQALFVLAHALDDLGHGLAPGAGARREARREVERRDPDQSEPMHVRDGRDALEVGHQQDDKQRGRQPRRRIDAGKGHGIADQDCAQNQPVARNHLVGRESIPDAANRVNELRVLRVALKIAPEPDDEVVDRARRAVVVEAPHLVEDVLQPAGGVVA